MTEYVQWFKNGDHPNDRVGEEDTDPFTGQTYEILEGRVVRYYRRPEPEFYDSLIHKYCGFRRLDHGWIDSGDEGQGVCPGSYVTVDEPYRVVNIDWQATNV